MLHAADYSNMDYFQVGKKLQERKMNDLSVARAMQYVSFIVLIINL